MRKSRQMIFCSIYIVEEGLIKACPDVLTGFMRNFEEVVERLQEAVIKGCTDATLGNAAIYAHLVKFGRHNNYYVPLVSPSASTLIFLDIKCSGMPRKYTRELIAEWVINEVLRFLVKIGDMKITAEQIAVLISTLPAGTIFLHGDQLPDRTLTTPA